jgi:HSP20 family protein
MAAIVRWNPWRELEQMQRRMRRTFEELDLAPSVFPAADVYETDGEVVVELEAPGFEEKEIDVEVADHTLVITGGRKEEKEQKQKSFWLRERLESTFERRFELPPETDTEKVSATFAKGVLAVHVPKTGKAPARKVPIGT